MSDSEKRTALELIEAVKQKWQLLRTWNGNPEEVSGKNSNEFYLYISYLSNMGETYESSEVGREAYAILSNILNLLLSELGKIQARMDLADISVPPAY